MQVGDEGIECTILRFIFTLFICVRSYFTDIDLVQFCSALNLDCFICMNCCDSPWLFTLWVFCFAEESILFRQNLIANLVIIINPHAIFACCVKIGLALPVISNYIPAGYELDVKEHVVSEYCHPWRGFKDHVIGRANGPCPIIKEDIDVIGGY
jgi:hypothetical protein